MKRHIHCLLASAAMFVITRKLKTPLKSCSGVWLSALTLAMGAMVENLPASEPKGNPINASLTLWQDAPVCTITKDKKVLESAQWDQWSLPIGNGRLGAVFFGYVNEDLIRFNEDSLWSGGDTEILEKPPGAKRPQNINFGSYQPFGDIHISLPHSEYTDYRRELDISRAVGTVTYKSGGVTYRREYFSSYPDQAIVIRLSADQPGSITGSVGLTDRHFAKITAEGNTITARGKLDEKIYVTKGTTDIAFGTPEQIASAGRHFAGNNMKYEAQVRVITDGGTLSKGADGELKVANANSVLILLAAGTDYLADAAKNWRGEDPHSAVTMQIDAASKRPYEQLLSRHLGDYQSLFNRLKLDLGKTDPKKTALPMDKRIEDYRKDLKDPELVTLMTQFGRYLLISCSRPGSRPANLQGLWNPERIMAAWGADYHLNVNLEMNYWQTGPGNLSECDEPLIYWLQSIVPVLTKKTKEQFNKPGWAAGWGVNLFGGGDISRKIEGAWICWHLYENYRFGGDKKLLETVSFPIIRDAVIFWENSLIEKDGLLLAPQVQSPEWGPTEDGVLYAQEIIWELFTEYIEISDILGKDKAHRNKIAAMRDKLATPKIGSRGEVMEWQSDQPKMWEKEHRHSSHLVGLFPGRQITPYGTPELAKAAAVSLKNRGVGITGWSKIHKAALYTRLFNADEAMMLVKEFVKINIWPSGLSAIKDASGSGDKFQIDANLGVTAVIYEMLLQSHTDELHLLPALPSEIPKGSVQGIRGRGGFLVDLTWADGKLTRAVIHSTLGNPCKIRYGQQVMELAIGKGQSVELNAELKKQ